MGIYHTWHKEFTKNKASVNQFSCFKKGQRHTFLSRRLHFREIFGIVVESYQHQHFLQYKQSRFVKNYNKFVVFFLHLARVYNQGHLSIKIATYRKPSMMQHYD